MGCACCESFFRVDRSGLPTWSRIQKGAKHPDTFESHTLSLPKEQYERMVKSFKLPLSWIETSSCVGPVFWSGIAKIEGKNYLRTSPPIHITSPIALKSHRNDLPQIRREESRCPQNQELGTSPLTRNGYWYHSGILQRHRALRHHEMHCLPEKLSGSDRSSALSTDLTFLV